MPDSTPQGSPYRIFVRRGDLALDISSPDPGWVDRKLELMGDLLFTERDRPATARLPAPAPDSPSKGRSLAEHVRAVGPSGGLEYVLAVGYYLERHSGHRGGFRRRDVAEAFRMLRYRHSNPGVPIAAARRRGLLMDGEEHEKVQLTETAERWVEERLAAEQG